MTTNPQAELVFKSEPLADFLYTLLVEGRDEEPDFVIGPPEDPYLCRWWLTPRGRQSAVYLHHMLKPDDDRALHDHPWESVSLCLSGGVKEHSEDLGTVDVKKGDIIYRSPTFAHRLDQPEPDTWTLFITGERVREWGFHCPKGWVSWKKFVEPSNVGVIGRGCGED